MILAFLCKHFFSAVQIGLHGLATGRRTELETLFSVEEAAKRLGGLSKYTIHAWLSQGKLRRTKVGARTMIRESELTRVIEDGGKSAGRPRGDDAL
jgi:excisionase family DNA binding protein